jgi:nicotinate-nucleotide adenylyltransferase
MRVGIFGGSFDPVHNGHLALARACGEAAELDEVWFTPTAIQPLKRHGPHAGNRDRWEMLKLAVESLTTMPGQPRRPPTWRVCTLEIKRGGFSYTVDTLRQILDDRPETDLFFLIGADALREVPNWKEPHEIFGMATPLVVRRAGQPEPDLSPLASLCANDKPPLLVEMDAIDASSSEIRRRIAAGEPYEHLVPQAVAKYIQQRGIYR